jgi:predicted nucleotidyltransferase
MKREDLETARDLKQRLPRCVRVVDMRVFGSRARGDARSSADMDIFLEVEEVSRDVRKAVADTAWELGLEKAIHISPLVFSKEEIERSPLRASPIVRAILREGVRI